MLRHEWREIVDAKWRVRSHNFVLLIDGITPRIDNGLRSIYNRDESLRPAARCIVDELQKIMRMGHYDRKVGIVRRSHQSLDVLRR